LISKPFAPPFKKQLSIWQVCFIIALIWFFVFVVFRQAPEWDNMEELVWANSFEWGYQKHPPLPSWIIYPLTMLFGKVMWLPIALGLTCVGLAQMISYYLYCRIAKNAGHSNPSSLGMLAVLTTSPLIYYSIRGGDFNHNAAQLWSIAAMFYFYYRTWEFEREIDKKILNYWLSWLSLGVFTGLAFITKYSVVIQAAVLIIHFLISGRWRFHKAWTGILLAACAFLFITTPHLYWLYGQTIIGQGPIYYVSHAMSTSASFFQRVWQVGYEFLFTQIIRVLPCLFIVGLTYRLCKTRSIDRKSGQSTPSWWLTILKADQVFLWVLAVGPTVLAMLIGIVFDQKIEAKWAVTFFIMIGFISWIFANDQLSLPVLTQQTITLHVVIGLGFGLVTGPLANYLGYQGRANFPSKALASVIQQRWQEHPELTKGEPIQLIVGDTWMIGNIIIHDPMMRGRNIKPWIDGEDLSSPWLKTEDQQKTALILIDGEPQPNGVWWRAGHPPTSRVQAMFDLANVKGVESIPWTSKEGAPPLKIQWAILPYPRP